jgi:hypothetical protein
VYHHAWFGRYQHYRKKVPCPRSCFLQVAKLIFKLRNKPPEINPYIYDQLIFDKGPSGERIISISSAGTTSFPHPKGPSWSPKSQHI